MPINSLLSCALSVSAACEMRGIGPDSLDLLTVASNGDKNH